MKLAIISIIFASVLVGCASPLYFTGAESKQELMEIRYKCLKESQTVNYQDSAYVNSTYGKSSAELTGTCSVSMFRACLAANGIYLAPEGEGIHVSRSEAVFCKAD